MESDYRIYVGIDWASEAHQACVLNHERENCRRAILRARR